MIYTPKKERLWDCWIVPYQGQFYMFYLSLTPERIGKGGWDGISLAISDDLVHWTEYGRVLSKREEAVWIGTGMIQKIGDTFIMNFSEEYPVGYQRIYFAKSNDLLHWERTEHVCVPDGINYMSEPNEMSDTCARWDSLGIVDALDDKGPPYYAFCTANAKQVNSINKNGGLGLLTSNDGLNWKCLPNAFPDPDMFPKLEVPEHICFQNRHYITFCTSSYLSHRFDKQAKDMSGGNYYVTSDNMLGPYRLPKGDYMLQGTRDNVSVSTVTVGRPLKVGNQVFFYHLWGYNGPAGWVTTVKILEEATPYQLRLRYNPINDCLKHTLLAQTADVLLELTLVKNTGVIPPMKFVLDGKISFSSLGTSAALSASPLSGCKHSESSTDLRDGRFVTFDLSLYSGVGAGIFFHGQDDSMLCILMNRERQRLEFGYLISGWGPNMVICDEICQEFRIQEKAKVKVLARRCFLEVYIDDIYVSSWRPEKNIDPNCFGFYFEDCTGEVDNLEIWQMG